MVDTQWVVFNHYNSHVCIDALLEIPRMFACALCMCVIAYSIGVQVSLEGVIARGKLHECGVR